MDSKSRCKREDWIGDVFLAILDKRLLTWSDTIGSNISVLTPMISKVEIGITGTSSMKLVDFLKLGKEFIIGMIFLFSGEKRFGISDSIQL